MEERITTLKYFPFALDLQGQKVLVVGGGKVAERKIDALLTAGAAVAVVAPDVIDTIRNRADQACLQWTAKEIERADIRNVRLVIAATNHTRVNEDVSRWAREEGVWINVVDQPDLSDFISPAVFLSEEGIVAVYSDGQDPVLSRDLKNYIKENWNEFLSYRYRLQSSSG